MEIYPILQNNAENPKKDYEPLKKEELAELLEANKRWGASEKTLEMATRLSQPETLAVVIGQQAGIFLGPLYTIYKALAAVKLARQLEQESGTPIVPIFWIASEDHDFEEIQAFNYLDTAGKFKTWRYQPDFKLGQSVFAIKTEPALAEFLQTLKSELRETEFTPDLFSLLENAISKSENLEDLFAILLTKLTADFGLVLVTPRMNFIRRRGAKILKQEFENPGESSKAVLASEDAGALHRKPEDVNAFLYDENWVRHKIQIHNEQFIIADGRKFSQQEIIALLDQHPEQFSFNVVTRPLVQDTVFPTLTQIGGPGEQAYLKQLASVYEMFNVTQPPVSPRPQAMLVEPRIRRALGKLDLEPRQFLDYSTKILHREIESIMDDPALKQIDFVEQDMQGLFDKLHMVIHDPEPPVRKAMDHLKKSTETGFAKIRERFNHQLLTSNTTLQASLDKATSALRPNNQPQERILNCWVPFINQYGMQLIPKLLDGLESFEDLNVIEL